MSFVCLHAHIQEHHWIFTNFSLENLADDVKGTWLWLQQMLVFINGFLTKPLSKCNTKAVFFFFTFLFNEPRCIVRFMVDIDVVGCCWIELPKGKYRVREEKSTTDTDSQYPGKVGLVHPSWHYMLWCYMGQQFISFWAPSYKICSVRLYEQCSWAFSDCFCPSGVLVSVRGGCGMDRFDKSPCRGRLAEDRTAQSP